jgi:hypothetical protein
MKSTKKEEVKKDVKPTLKPGATTSTLKTSTISTTKTAEVKKQAHIESKPVMTASDKNVTKKHDDKSAVKKKPEIKKTITPTHAKTQSTQTKPKSLLRKKFLIQFLLN